MKNAGALNKRKSERGVGAFEIALVIVLMGIIAAGTLWVTRGTDGKVQAQALREHLGLVINASVRLSIADVSYENASTSSLVSSGLLPERILAGSSIRNPAGGYTQVTHMDVGPQCSTNSCANMLTVTMTGIDNAETCTTLMGLELSPRVHRRRAIDVSSGDQAREDQNYQALCMRDGEKHFRYSVM